MKKIKYKLDGKTYEDNVYVDDLRRIRGTITGDVEAHIFLIGDVILLEVDGESIRKPWGLVHNLEEFTNIWNTDHESRFVQSLTIRNQLSHENKQYFRQYDDSFDRYGSYIEMLGQSDKYNDPTVFNSWFEKQLELGKTSGEILYGLSLEYSRKYITLYA